MKLKIFIRSLLIFIVVAAAIKLGFELDNYFFESKLMKMKDSRESSVVINSHIEHKTLKINNTQIHYYISGTQNEKSIVFLHAAFSDHRAFAQQIDYFSAD